MYDAVFVLVEALTKILRKKPDQFRSYTLRRVGSQSSSSNATLGSSGSGQGGTGAAAPRVLDCNTSKGWVNPWEHGDRISRYLRKVSRVSPFACLFVSVTFFFFLLFILKRSG